MGAKSAMRRGPTTSSLVTFLLVVAGAYVGYALCWQTPPPPPALDYADRVAAYCSAPVDAGDEGGEGLVAATVVVRHGARSAIHDPPGTGRADVFDCSLPARVAAVASRWPRAKRFRAATRGWHRCAEGQLVARGYDQHLRLGAFLRRAYGAADRAWTASARSTDYARTRASAASLLTAFLDDAAAADVSARSDPATEPMFGVEGEDGRGLPCEAGAAAARAQRAAWATPAADAAAITAALPTLPGDFRPTEVADAAYSRACELARPLCVAGDRCLAGDAANRVFDAADRYYAARYGGAAGGALAARLGMHPLLEEIVAGFRRTLAAEDSDVLRVFVGHDTVVAPLLSALGAYDGVWPPLASRVVFELYEGPAVRVLFNGRAVSVDGCPPAPRYCPLDAFEAAVAALLGGAPTFEAACAA